MRGENFSKKIVEMNIVDGKGIVVNPGTIVPMLLKHENI